VAASTFYKRRTLITAGSLGGILLLARTYNENCAEDIELCEIYANNALFIIIVVFIFAAIFLIWKWINFVILKRQANAAGGFIANPSSADKKFIDIEGIVVRVYRESVREHFRKKTVHLWRTFLKSGDHSGRHIHQKFLIQSPRFPKKEFLLVHHNVTFGRLQIRKGSRIKLKGEYIHMNRKKQGFLGAAGKMFGLLHHTHEPTGFARVLPSGATLSDKITVDG
jgi:hypothetical protein